MKNNSAQATKVITAHVPLLMADAYYREGDR